MQSALKQSYADGTLFLALAAIALWALTHPYIGIIGDAKVYVGRALADLDPAGVGRDMVFVHDGQSRFSLFPILLDHLVAAFGTSPTALMLALCSMVAWIAALCCLARQFVPARAIFFVVICVALLPVAYGSPSCFSYSEILALPRPFAEALVILALAALAGGHCWRAFLVLIAASLVHPIMALAGWGVFGFVLCREGWRWRVAAALIAGSVLAAAFLHAPLFGRLVTTMNPDLKAFAIYRSSHLFPTTWPMTFLGPVVVEATTIMIAASFFESRRRTVLLAVVVVGIGGLIAQIVLGDYLSLLLVIQAQFWRTTWLLAAMGAATLAMAGLALWNCGPRGHVVLAILSIAWLASEEPLPSVVLCSIALIAHFDARLITTPISWNGARVVLAAAFALALFLNVQYFIDYRALIARVPADAFHPMDFFWSRRYVAFPIIGLALTLVSVGKPSRALWITEGVATVLFVTAAISFWDSRPFYQKLVDSGRHPPELMALIASRPGDVLWIDGLAEAWFLTGRPQWASRQQGVSTVFSPELTREWRERMHFLIQEELADPGAVVAVHIAAGAELPRVTPSNVSHLCTRSDAPAWIITPVWDNMVIPSELKPRYWHLPQPTFRISEESDSYMWHPISAIAVLPCART